MSKVTDAPTTEVGGIYLQGVSSDCLNRAELEEWLRNAPGKKPMYTTNPDAQGRLRGMPNLGLSEAQIDSIVTYLQTLK